MPFASDDLVNPVLPNTVPQTLPSPAWREQLGRDLGGLKPWEMLRRK
jgi:hypothetical protein